MFKCLRCGKESNGKISVVIGVWDIPYGINGYLFTNEHKAIALCPDCQLPKKEEKIIYKEGSITQFTKAYFAEHEKRIAKLERENDRIWEIIKCIGEK